MRQTSADTLVPARPPFPAEARFSSKYWVEAVVVLYLSLSILRWVWRTLRSL